MANFENLTCFVTLTFWFQTLFKFFVYNFHLYIIIIYDWITIMRYSKHALSKKKNKKQVVLPKNLPIPTHNGHLLLSPRWLLWKSGSTVLNFTYKSNSEMLNNVNVNVFGSSFYTTIS